MCVCNSIAHQLARDQSDLAGLEKDLAELEARYDMDSEEFYVRYREGQLGDDADFVEWSALYQMVTKLRARTSRQGDKV